MATIEQGLARLRRISDKRAKAETSAKELQAEQRALIAELREMGCDVDRLSAATGLSNKSIWGISPTRKGRAT